jgi:Holliday junction resolvase RusA-like endonuclease
MARWVLPWPVSVNHLYVRRKGGQVRLSDQAQAWRDEAILRVRASGERPPAGPLLVSVELWGLERRYDADNFLKITLDAVFAAFGRDDADIQRLTVSKYRLPVSGVPVVVVLMDWAYDFTHQGWPPPLLPPLEAVGAALREE